MNKKTAKLYIGLAILIVAFYFIYQSFILFSSPIKTEKLKSFTAYDSYETQGIAFRTEEIIRSSVSGTPQYSLSDGERVKKSSTIATVYSKTGTAEQRAQIRDIENKIALFESGKNDTDLYLSDATGLEISIDNAVNSINEMKLSGDMAEYQNKVNELQLLLIKKQLVLGEIEDIDTYINDLKNQLKGLQSASDIKSGTVKAEKSGFFSSHFDGYENLINPAQMLENGYEAFLTVSALEKGSDKPENYIGKIATEFYWYYATTLPTSEFKSYNVDDTLNLRIKSASSDIIPAVVVHTEQVDSENIYIIFKCEYYDSSFVNLRFEKVDVITNTYSGYRVNRDAVRMVEDVTGVYVQAGSQIQFKEVKVLFSKDDYMIIASSQEGTKRALQPNEYIVVEGKELFDGKIIS
ncbi:MAG: hypothetical protein E7480_05035 [Ruminococcaceae bacterium]|nr:hypothetical protein [Oscillospiraceae bacterium]